MAKAFKGTYSLPRWQKRMEIQVQGSLVAKNVRLAEST